MYEPTIQKQEQGRFEIRRAPSHCSGLVRVSIPELQRTSIIDRHFQAVFGKQQRKAGAVRESLEASGMDKQCDHSQSQERVALIRLANRDKEGSKAKQGKLVCADLAVLGLVTRDGYFQIRIPQGSVSARKFQTPKKWSRDPRNSFRKWSKGIPHYFRKWSYAGHLTPSLYFKF